MCKGLLDQGFTPSITDPCLWIRHDCIICQYVDDCLIFANTDQTIDSFIHQMRQAGYLLKDEGTVENFLGINIDHSASTRGKKVFEMKQTGLIETVMDELNLNTDRCKLHNTPSDIIIHPDLDKPVFEEA